MNLNALTDALSRGLLLAQENAGGDASNAPAGNVPPPTVAEGFGSMVPMLVAFMVMFYFIVMRPQQKEQQKRKDLLSELKKNDKVLTIGGIIGTIVDFSNDGARVTLRVDDGTRIKFTRSSIQGTYDEKAEADTEASK